MKKILLLLCLLIMPVLKINSEELSKYVIKDCTIYLDNDVWKNTVTRDIADDDSRTNMESNMIYLYSDDSSSNPIMFNLTINKTDNVPNMHTLSNEEIESYMNGYKDLSIGEIDVSNVSVYKNDKYKFIVAEYSESDWYLKSYGTVINGYTYAFKIFKKGKLESKDIEKLLNIINKVEFKIDSSYENKAAFKSTTFKGTSKALAAALATIICSIISLVYNKLKSNNKNIKADNIVVNESKEGHLLSVNNSEDVITCSNCGAKVNGDDIVCPSCGAQFVEDDEDNFITSQSVKEVEKAETNDESYVITCSNCGAKVNDEDVECPKCGAQFVEDDEEKAGESVSAKENQEEIFTCSNCGAVVSENSSKCPNCGETFDDEDTTSDIDKKYKDLNKLKKLLDKNIITQKEFEHEKKKVLKK